MFSERVVVENGKKNIVVPQGLKRPFMKDFYEFESWVRSEYDAAMDVKRRVESGQLAIRSVKKEMSRWVSKKRSSFAKEKALRCEMELLLLNHRLRESLGKQASYCVELLEEMGRLKLTPLMLKKNPLVVETLCKLTKSDVDETVKSAANGVLRKLRHLFKVTEDMSFLEVYAAQENKFKERTSDLQLLTSEGLLKQISCWRNKKFNSV